jgi:phosphoserine phosphatase
MADESCAVELAQRVAVLIGMIMEDEVERAVSALPSGYPQMIERLEALRQAGADIALLAAAAEVALKRS